jgi:hypothetical protein
MPEPLSGEDVQALAAQVREVIAQGERRQRKALLQSFVQEIRVVSRAEIYPFFFSPLFDHRAGQCPRQESNLGTRFRKPLLYPLSYGGATGAR